MKPSRVRRGHLGPDSGGGFIPVQMEFEALVKEAVELSMAAPRDFRLFQMKPQSRENASGPVFNPAMGAVLTKAGLDERWLDGVVEMIRCTPDLRTALVVLVSHVSELIDLDLPRLGLLDKWEGQYRGYCYAMAQMCREGETADGGVMQEEDEVCIFVWEEAAQLFEIYESLHSLTDWHLEERVCEEYAEECAVPPDAGSREKCWRSVFVAVVSVIHGWITGDESEEAE